jgi:hypothetical protein
MLVGPMRFTPEGRSYHFEGEAALGRLNVRHRRFVCARTFLDPARQIVEPEGPHHVVPLVGMELRVYLSS